MQMVFSPNTVPSVAGPIIKQQSYTGLRKDALSQM